MTPCARTSIVYRAPPEHPMPLFSSPCLRSNSVITTTGTRSPVGAACRTPSRKEVKRSVTSHVLVPQSFVPIRIEMRSAPMRPRIGPCRGVIGMPPQPRLSERHPLRRPTRSGYLRYRGGGKGEGLHLGEVPATPGGSLRPCKDAKQAARLETRDSGRRLSWAVRWKARARSSVFFSAGPLCFGMNFEGIF
jgi:hypothetical protein